jgi:hypothetical protein
MNNQKQLTERRYFRVITPDFFSNLTDPTLGGAIIKLKEWGEPNPRMTPENVKYWAEMRTQCSIVEVIERTYEIDPEVYQAAKK